METTTPYIESLIDQLELIKSDLRYQLSLEIKEIDWSYFKGNFEKYIDLQDWIQKLKVSLARGPIE